MFQRNKVWVKSEKWSWLRAASSSYLLSSRFRVVSSGSLPLFNPNDNEPSSLLLKRSECEDAAAIRDTLEKASLNFQDCEDVTPSHECVSDTLGAIAGCYKDLAIDSDCVQETFDVSEDIRIVVFKLTICTYFCFLETSKWYPNTVFLSRMEKVSVHDFRC